ncbi:hypothetical protein BAUCODRAFT_23621 [Baudoinia panamericana UAMH 10762]|uniref:FAD-binding FR-type domain-containing protein n=1 Tax=Baudoinia panamericana (strain UAMH 10762) TaxID=717646 RepID=M2N048_BAUPA|nr:uncharacterized protein BAUCODRAFT_23621 [Baudoinia panamericana UAMH 10762]EMC97298.1 hypothetical protein BAUCODRAFT_23621 [Baudoinia panamericana UAMH 10762]
MDLILIIAIILLGPLLLASTLRLALRVGRHCSRKAYIWLLYHVVYPRILPGDMHLVNPSRAEILLLLLHWSITGFFNAYDIHSRTEFSRRAGQIAVLHMLPLLASQPLSLLADILGMSLHTLLYGHTVFGVMAALQGVLHAIFSPKVALTARSSKAMALTLLIALLLLAFLPVVKSRVYEIFLRTHVLFSIALAVTTWIHIGNEVILKRSLLVAYAMCIASGLWRTCYTVRSNIHFRTSRITSVSDVIDGKLATILELQLPRDLHFKPGQYVYITLVKRRSTCRTEDARQIPSKQLELCVVRMLQCVRWAVQRHPFVITWWQDSMHKSSTERMYVAIGQQHGWTREVTAASTELNSAYAWLDGPYGHNIRFEEYGAVLFFATGAGIFAVQPYLKGLTRLIQAGRAKIRRLTIVWVTDVLTEKVPEWMETLLHDSYIERDASLPLLRIAIHQLDKAGKSIEKCGARLIVHKNTQPNIDEYLQEQVNHGRTTAVAFSVHARLRFEIRDKILGGKSRIFRLFALSYQPHNADFDYRLDQSKHACKRSRVAVWAILYWQCCVINRFHGIYCKLCKQAGLGVLYPSCEEAEGIVANALLRDCATGP